MSDPERAAAKAAAAQFERRDAGSSPGLGIEIRLEVEYFPVYSSVLPQI
jgi:hypothetical protein